MKEVLFDSIEHKYYFDGKEFPSYSKIMKHFGMSQDYEKFGNEKSRLKGDAIHLMTKLYDLGDLGKYDPNLTPYLNGYKMFLAHYKPEWKMIETPMISLKWGFAGTLDRAGVIKKNVLIDFKSGLAEPSHEIQTSAYQILVEENTDIKIQERYSLYLLENDFRLVQHTNPADKTIFIGLAQAYRWKIRQGKIKENENAG